MKHATHKLLCIALAAAVGTAGLLLSDRASFDGSGALVTEAVAIIGRPLTPLSYAGVARRTTRRAVAVGTALAAAPACVQRVDAYGRIYYRCP